MKIKSIRIEFELGEKDIPNHATEVVFQHGMWTANGPLYSRITSSLHEVWKIVKTAVTANP